MFQMYTLIVILDNLLSLLNGLLESLLEGLLDNFIKLVYSLMTQMM